MLVELEPPPPPPPPPPPLGEFEGEAELAVWQLLPPHPLLQAQAPPPGPPLHVPWPLHSIVHLPSPPREKQGELHTQV